MPVDLPPPPRPETPRRDRRMGALLALQALTFTGVVLIILVFRPGGDARDEAARARDVASKLKAAGALAEAASLYESHLKAAGPGGAGRAAMAYSLGSLHLEQGQYEKALRWFYEAEALGAGDLSGDVGRKIVHCLEAMGRGHAAAAALAAHTRLAPTGAPRPSDDPVVARIGKEEVRRSDVVRSLDDLPPQLKQRFQGETGRNEYLRKYVADELIFRKAQKLEVDRDPEVRRQQQAIGKQLVVGRFIEKEVLDKLQVAGPDLQNFYAAHREQYDEPDLARVRLIKVASKEKADALRAKLERGAAFDKLAREESLDAATRERGGLVERWLRPGEPFLGEGDPEEVAKVLFATAAGKTAGPLAAGAHHYLFRVEQVQRGQKRSFDEVHARVEQDYRAMKAQAAYADMIQQELSTAGAQFFPDKMAEGS